jgi:hypothetical protein
MLPGGPSLPKNSNTPIVGACSSEPLLHIRCGAEVSNRWRPEKKTWLDLIMDLAHGDQALRQPLHYVCGTASAESERDGYEKLTGGELLYLFAAFRRSRRYRGQAVVPPLMRWVRWVATGRG